MKTYIGIDNGVSGSIGIIYPSGEPICFDTPTIKMQDYTKKQKMITRVNTQELEDELRHVSNSIAVLERPMVNPKMFMATCSALRSLEATLVVLELLQVPYMFIDSKQWQKELLPKGTKGKDELKKASADIGTRLFPKLKKHFVKDADGILIAEWARRNNL